VPLVRRDAGYPPLVTPSSQIVGTQAVFNVLMGRYQVLTGEFADLMLGYYGATLGERDPEVVAIAGRHAGKQPITCRPADLLGAEWEDLRASALSLDGCDGTDEDVLTYAMFPQVAPKFFGARAAGPAEVEPPPVPPPAPNGREPVRTPVSYDVTVGDRTHRVTVQPS
jgi:methylmalonyl-CoA carboxyltransferase 5S subunit